MTNREHDVTQPRRRERLRRFLIFVGLGLTLGSGCFGPCGICALSNLGKAEFDFKVESPSNGDVIEGPITFVIKTGVEDKSRTSIAILADGEKVMEGYVPGDPIVWNPAPRPSGPITLTVNGTWHESAASWEDDSETITIDWVSPTTLGPGPDTWTRIVACTEEVCEEPVDDQIIRGDETLLALEPLSHPDQVTRAEIWVDGDTIFDATEPPWQVMWPTLELPDGGYTITGRLHRADGVLSEAEVLLNVANCRPPGYREGHDLIPAALSLACGPNHDLYLTDVSGIQLRRYRTEYGWDTEWMAFPGHGIETRVALLAISDDGWLVAVDQSGSSHPTGHVAVLDDPINGTEFVRIHSARLEINDIVVGPDEAIWYAGHEGVTRLTREGEALSVLDPQPGSGAHALAFLAEDTLLVAAMQTGGFRLWRVTLGEDHRELTREALWEDEYLWELVPRDLLVEDDGHVVVIGGDGAITRYPSSMDRAAGERLSTSLSSPVQLCVSRLGYDCSLVLGVCDSGESGVAFE